MPAGLDQRIGIMAWSPLQAGLLSGKFRRGQPKPAESRLNSLDAPGTIDEERLYRIVDALAEVAAQRGVPISHVALNWVMRKPCVDTVIIGARNEQQLRDNIAAASWTLTDAEVKISTMSAPFRRLTHTGISRNSPATATRRRSTSGNAAKQQRYGFFGPLNDRSTISCTSVDTPWSRHSQRIISGKTVRNILWPWR